jgi:hypothetical protein
VVIPQVWLRIGIPDRRFVHCRVKRFHVTGDWPLPPGRTFKVSGVAANGARLDHHFEVIQCNHDGDSWTLDVEPVDPSDAPDWLHAHGRHAYV